MFAAVLFSSALRRQPRRLLPWGLGLLLLHVGASSAAEAVTTLRDLRRAVQSQERALRDVRLEAEVCATDPARGLLALRDDTGAEVLALDLGGQTFQPGERLRLIATHGAVVRRRWSLALTTAPVVDNGGVHSVATATGRIHLEVGLHPIRLYYFNVENPAELEVRYAGPGVPPQPIPAQALFLETDTNGVRANGLEFFCYDDTPASLDRLDQQPPVFRGVVSQFDIRQRRPEEDVAMQFRGLLRIEQAGEYTFTLTSDDGSELHVGAAKPILTRLGAGPPPPAPLLAAQATGPAPEQTGWRTLEGVVAFAGKTRHGLELLLRDNHRTTRLWLADAETLPPGLLLNARVRATGVHRGVISLNADGEAGVMTVVRPEHLQLLAVAPDQWQRNPVLSVARARELTNTSGLVVHLRGVVNGPATNGSFALRDDTGSLLIEPSVSGEFAVGQPLEVLGVLSPAPGLRVTSAITRAVAKDASAPPVLTTAAQVQQLSTREAALQHPVVVRGVITCLVEWGGAVVQDATRGVFFSFEPSYRDGLEPGDFAEIEGVTAVGDFAPIITARSLRVLGSGQLPEPVRPTWNQLLSGSLDAQFAEVRGVVTEASGNRITLLTEGGKIRVVLHDTGEAALRRLLNTLVRIRGCLLAVWDADTRQVRVGEIRFRNPTIAIDQLPMADPFDAPEKTIPDLLLFDLNASGFERVKISGQIVHARGGELFLMQGERGLRFRLATDAQLGPGDLVEVVGIPDLSGPSPRLHEALARKTGTAPLPPAVPWAAVEAAGKAADALRVETEARLIGLHRAGAEWVLELQAGLRAFRARLTSPENLPGTLPLGSRLQVTGVCAALTGERDGDVAGFELLLNSPAEIVLLQRPPWWTLRRLLYIVASLVAVLAVAGIWISQLRRQVALRTAQLEREHARRERAEREHALEAERSRIARDLHDDLGSSLTEIRALASRGLRVPNADAQSPMLFQSIAEKSRKLVAALDVIVWAVDPEANSLQSVADYLSGYAGEYLAHAGLPCRFRIPVTLPAARLEGQARHELFLAVKETLHNIVQHAQATGVEFHLAVDDQGLQITIADNGRGFATDSSAAGHGLKNIAQRLARIGGQCHIESQPGRGTRVRITLPLAEPVAALT